MKKPNPMAKDLRQPKYKQQVIPDKKKPVPKRKEKHKGKNNGWGIDSTLYLIIFNLWYCVDNNKWGK